MRVTRLAWRTFDTVSIEPCIASARYCIVRAAWNAWIRGCCISITRSAGETLFICPISSTVISKVALTIRIRGATVRVDNIIVICHLIAVTRGYRHFWIWAYRVWRCLPFKTSRLFADKAKQAEMKMVHRRRWQEAIASGSNIWITIS